LLTRIAALEKQVQDGAIKASVCVNTESAQAERKTTERKIEPVKEKEIVEETPFIPEMEAPPDEAETGGNVYFDEDFLPKKKPVQAVRETPVAKPTAVAAEKNVASGDAKTVFGAFLRCLRKTGKSGVLFAICMDLEYAYEGEKFTFYTDSETIYNSLIKAEHYPIIKAAFEGIGIAEDGFAIRLRGKAADTFNKDLEKLKQTFGGVKIDVK